jgi:Dolichyl-phosphate-mannose-protein mannosyltransferase
MLKHWPFVLILLCFSLIVLSPNLVRYSHDSGVFLYIGQQILDGKLPYRDVWDHKPPLIFYINALSILLFGSNQFSTLPAQFLAVGSAAVIGYLTLSRYFGRFIAFLSSLLWLAGLALVMQFGNLTEQYALCFQFGALFLFCKYYRVAGWNWGFCAIGILGGLTFFLKFHLIGIWLAIFLILVIDTKLSRQFWLNLAALISGGGIVMAVICGYYLLNGSFDIFFDALITYNIAYSRGTDRLDVILSGLLFLSVAGISIFGILGWLLGIRFLLLKKSETAAFQPALSLILAGLPIELFIITLTGFPFRQYFMAWLPLLSFATAFFLWRVFSFFQKAFATGKFQNLPAYTTLGVLTLLCLILPLKAVGDLVAVSEVEGRKTQELLSYVRQNSSEKDYVLLWAAGAYYNFITNRTSPTRYIYFEPLYTTTYKRGVIGEEFYGEITGKRPLLIVDNSQADGYSTPPLGEENLRQWLAATPGRKIPAEIEKTLSFINSNYSLVAKLHSDRLPVYRLKTP